jgi:glycosyltransferase involved in cell wall biosynthesis
MKKSRLLIVTDDAIMGGTYRVAEQLAKGLVKFFDVQFACTFNAKNAASCIAIATAGARIHDYQVSASNLERSAFAVVEAEEILDRTDPDMLLLVEAAEIWSLLALKQVAKRRAIPYVTVVNLLSADCLEHFTQLREPAIEAMQGAHAIIFVSNASKRTFEALLPQICSPRFAIANSCPDKFFLATGEGVRAAVRKALGIGDHELVFLTASRIEPRKGQILCLEALERIRDRDNISGIRLLLAGGDTSGHTDGLRKAIEKKELSDNVLFLGPRDDIPNLLEACDVFVLTSYAEGMPLSIIEAMAKGRPVIATSVDGIPEQIDDSSGILVPSPSNSEAACVDAIADAMTFMRENSAACVAMGKCARSRATRLFSEDRMIREYADILSDLALARRNAQRNGSWFGRFSLQEKTSCISSICSRVSDFGQAMAARLVVVERKYSVDAKSKFELEPGSVIDFLDPLQCWNRARGGWYQTESEGVWSEGTVSIIELRMRQRMKRLRIVFDLTPFVPPGHRQRTDVVVNGRQICSWDFGVYIRETRTIDVSMNRAKDKRLAEIQLIHRTPTSPKAFDMGDDSREIAICLHEIRVE